MGLSRNKVAVPEGAAGTPPFWSTVLTQFRVDSLEFREGPSLIGSHSSLVLNFMSVKIITIFDILKAKANLSKVSDFI